MGKGGARIGAGRPKKQLPQSGVLLGMDGSRIFGPPAGGEAPADPSATALDALRVPPADLPKPQREIWAAWAPLAIERRTLVPGHAPGFRQLCRLAWVAGMMERRLARLGPATEAAESLMTRYVKVEQRLESALQRFDLTGMGKPVTDAARKKAPGAGNQFGWMMGAR